MDISFHKIDGSHDAICFEYASPEEKQTYDRALVLQVPEGSYLATRAGKAPSGRQCTYVGVAKIGEQLRLESDGTANPQANKPAPVPRALEVPEVIKNADDAALEVMAGRNGIQNLPKWRTMNRALREASVASAMQKMNAR